MRAEAIVAGSDEGRLMNLTSFSVLTFDCYGTLIDWETGIHRALANLIGRTGRRYSPDQALEAFARHESEQEAETGAMPYPELLSMVYTRLAGEWGVEATRDEADAFGASVPDWPEFPDSRDALCYLKRFYRLVILSNVDRASFRGSNARLGVEFDAIYCASDIGSYKPSLRNFEYMIDHVRAELGFGPESILHTAQSLFHDHEPANRIGLASAWIDRRHAASGWGATLPPANAPRYAFRFESMAAMANAHRLDDQAAPLEIPRTLPFVPRSPE